MPARIILVHDYQALVGELSAALEAAGYSVAPFLDPMRALDVISSASTAEILITKVDFGPGKPNGVALALMARYRRPGIRIIFPAKPEMREYTAHLGDFLALPVRVPDVMDAVNRLLKNDPPEPAATISK